MVRTFARVAGAAAAFALSLVLVATTPSNAQAAVVGEGVAIAVAEAGEVVGTGEGAELVAGACATGAGCLVAGAVMLGVGLYMTRDTWLPMVHGFMNKLGLGEPLAPADWFTADAYTIDPAHPNQVIMSLHGQIPTGNSAYGWTWNIFLKIGASGECQRPDGSQYYISTSGQGVVANINTGQTMTQNQATTAVATVCTGAQDFIVAGTYISGRVLHNGSAERVFNTTMIQTPVQEPSTVTYTATSHCLEVVAGEAGGDPTTIPHDVTSSVTGDPDKLPVASCEAHGWLPAGVTVTNPATGAVVGDWTMDNPLSQFGNCFGPTGALLCKTTVYVNGKACTSAAEAPGHCVDWWTYKDGHPSEVECRFGGYVVPYANCKPLQHAFPTAGTTVDTIPTVDGDWDPDGDHNGDPDPDPDCPAGYHMNSHGLCLQDTTDDPTDPTGTGTNPDPGDGSSCMGGAFTLNPVDWVYVPVKCAMVWAFVPQTSLATRAAAIKGAFDNKAPFAWFGSVFQVPGALPSSSCPDWVMHVHGWSQNVVCDSPYVNAIRAARPFLTAGMLALAFTPLLRGLMYASVPLLKPTPTDGK